MIYNSKLQNLHVKNNPSHGVLKKLIWLIKFMIITRELRLVNELYPALPPAGWVIEEFSKISNDLRLDVNLWSRININISADVIKPAVRYCQAPTAVNTICFTGAEYEQSLYSAWERLEPWHAKWGLLWTERHNWKEIECQRVIHYFSAFRYWLHLHPGQDY